MAGHRLKPFVANWKLWWAELQPIWRSTEQWPFDHTVPAGSSWDVLLQGGPNGVYSVIVSLGWWVSAVSGQTKQQDEAFDVAKDVRWVFEQLFECTGKLGGVAKRKVSDSESTELNTKTRKKTRRT